METETKFWIGKALFIISLGFIIGAVFGGITLASMIIGIMMVMGWTLMIENLNKK